MSNIDELPTLDENSTYEETLVAARAMSDYITRMLGDCQHPYDRTVTIPNEHQEATEDIPAGLYCGVCYKPLS